MNTLKRSWIVWVGALGVSMVFLSGATAQKGVGTGALDATQSRKSVTVLRQALDPVNILRGEVEDLTTQVTELKKQVAALKTELADTTQRINTANSVPGYATTFITKDNWNVLPGNTGLRVWMRH